MAPSVAATEDVSGHGAGLDKDLKVPAGVSSAGDEKIVVNTIRCLAADLCQQVSTPVLITGIWLTGSTRVDIPEQSWELLPLVSLSGDITCSTTQRTQTG
jgi:hypothetical protein